jgi:hypothetical protein
MNKIKCMIVGDGNNGKSFLTINYISNNLIKCISCKKNTNISYIYYSKATFSHKLVLKCNVCNCIQHCCSKNNPNVIYSKISNSEYIDIFDELSKLIDNQDKLIISMIQHNIYLDVNKGNLYISKNDIFSNDCKYC